MKFQKDNSNIALTQQMKDEVAAKEKAEELRKENELKEIQKLQEEILEKRDIYLNQLEQLKTRSYLYGPIEMQLDMLWHDMDEGRIYADTTSENSWYLHIKRVKDYVHLSADWENELTDAYEDLKRVMTSNNNSQDV